MKRLVAFFLTSALAIAATDCAPASTGGKSGGAAAGGVRVYDWARAAWILKGDASHPQASQATELELHFGGGTDFVRAKIEISDGGSCKRFVVDKPRYPELAKAPADFVVKDFFDVENVVFVADGEPQSCSLSLEGAAQIPASDYSDLVEGRAMNLGTRARYLAPGDQAGRFSDLPISLNLGTRSILIENIEERATHFRAMLDLEHRSFSGFALGAWVMTSAQNNVTFQASAPSPAHPGFVVIRRDERDFELGDRHCRAFRYYDKFAHKYNYEETSHGRTPSQVVLDQILRDAISSSATGKSCQYEN
jgi:hypothetical protein